MTTTERPRRGPAKGLLRLYVSGSNPRCQRAVEDAQRLCEEQLAGAWEVTVIDVLETPEVAEDERVIAVPTLELKLPPPARRVIGDLSDTAAVIPALGLAA